MSDVIQHFAEATQGDGHTIRPAEAPELPRHLSRGVRDPKNTPGMPRRLSLRSNFGSIPR